MSEQTQTPDDSLREEYEQGSLLLGEARYIMTSQQGRRLLVEVSYVITWSLANREVRYVMT